MSHWLSPPLVDAPSASDRERLVKYHICPELISVNAGIFRRTPVFQIWAHVVGELPPINNIAYLARGQLPVKPSTLEASVACFKGVNRPYDQEGDGGSILVYVLTPAVSIAYEPSLGCLAKAVRVPSKTVCTVQVKPIDSLQIGGIDVTGQVTRIEFVPADDATTSLPSGFKTRYSECLWR